ncbi:Proline iminopeptidase [Indibacter alkaliphilus LW1]|uniref:Proline iminopeptidase n=1 Tax=Indibacter alkaliphilus (strain CCUG 57479 / KCTC 22604 / LW1) TaxID=1189612 RepID=S2DVA1_INDAL|nr:proline iminopeptidase-family hydrolase [Indibacter alkaliphilus]EOZ96001.1 Proline iminopeptidase [Indibacter alkaliphilus LW1]
MKKRYLSYSGILFALILFYSCSQPDVKKIGTGEGYVEVEGGKVWYEIVGEGDKLPVLLLHGGPGGTSFGFEPLKEMDYEGPLIFMDQLGSGRSTALSDTSLMTVENYVDQVEKLRKQLGLDEFVLYGSSWGTMLGIAYITAYPEAVKGVIFSSPLFSTDMWIADADTLIATLPDSVQQVIRYHEEMGEFDHPDYQEAITLYYSLYVRRKESPKVDRSHMNLSSGKEIYEYMWGPSEFTSTGTLRSFDRLNDLGKIKAPTLLFTGEFDEARPSTVEFYASLVPDSRFVVIPDAAHATLNDNKEFTLKTVKEFLEEINH